LAIIVLLASLGFHEVAQQKILAKTLDQEIAKLEAPVKEVHGLREQAKQMQDRVISVEKIFKTRDMTLEALRELSNVLPMDTYLSSYNYNEQTNTIQIVGISTYSLDLAPMLEKSPLFKDVTQRGAIFKPQPGGKYNFNYEMKLER
jgi:Tfp pilus assembly protein PilN